MAKDIPLRVKELCVCQRRRDTCGACSQERKQTCKDSKAGAQQGKLFVWSQGEGGGPRRHSACRLSIVTTVAPAASDRMALEGVVKRGFVDLV